jgi:hypothetical protein
MSARQTIIFPIALIVISSRVYAVIVVVVSCKESHTNDAAFGL